MQKNIKKKKKKDASVQAKKSEFVHDEKTLERLR